MASLKDMIEKFGIECTKTWISKGNKRKRDGKRTKLMRFNIKSNSTNTFINQIGWHK